MRRHELCSQTTKKRDLINTAPRKNYQANDQTGRNFAWIRTIKIKSAAVNKGIARAVAQPNNKEKNRAAVPLGRKVATEVVAEVNKVAAANRAAIAAGPEVAKRAVASPGAAHADQRQP
jgi:hypothetical protein